MNSLLPGIPPRAFFATWADGVDDEGDLIVCAMYFDTYEQARAAVGHSAYQSIQGTRAIRASALEANLYGDTR